MLCILEPELIPFYILYYDFSSPVHSPGLLVNSPDLRHCTDFAFVIKEFPFKNKLIIFIVLKCK